MNNGGIPFCPEYILVTGNVPAGILLAYLVSGSSDTNETDDSLKQRTGLSLGQVRRARRSLEGLGLVETGIIGFGSSKTTHYWLNQERLRDDIQRVHDEGLDRRLKRDCDEGDF